MEKNKLLFKRRQVPIGTRLHERLKPLGLLRLWLLVLLIGWSSGAKAGDEFTQPWQMKATTTSFDPLTDYNIYEFKFCLGYSYYGNDYFADGYSKVTFYLDGQAIGSIDKSVLKKFLDLAREKSDQSTEYKSLQTIKGNINNVTDVYIGINDCVRDASYSWYTIVRLGIERHWSYKSSYTFEARCTAGGYTSSGSTYGQERALNHTFTLSAPTNKAFPATGGTLKRTGNKEVTFTAPSLTERTSTDSKGTFTWKYLVNLLKEAGKNSEPYIYISQSAHKYASLDKAATGSTVSFTASNYDPITVYPCWEMYSERNYEMWGPSYVQRYHKYYEGLTVPGYPSATNVNIETYNAYSKQLKVTWGSKVKDNKHADTNGQWVILRKYGSTVVRLDAVSYSKDFYIDKGENGNDLAYGKEYTYIVVFQPNAWGVNVAKESDAEGLSASNTYTLKTSFYINQLKAVAGENNIKVTWNHEAIQDAASNKPYIYYVERTTNPNDASSWTVVNGNGNGEQVTSNEVTSGSFTDTKNLSANTTYYYRVRFEKVQDQSNFTGNVTTFAKMGGSSIESVTTSRGTYTNVVKVTWNVNQKGDALTYFSLQRRPLGTEGDNGWMEIYTTSGTAASYSYDDQTAQPGSFNEYRVVLYEKVNGSMQKGNDATCDGFCMARGVVSGRVAFGSGTAVQDVKVTMRPNDGSGKTVNGFRSLMFNSTSRGIKADLTQDELKKIFNNSDGFTTQIWVKPDDNIMTSTSSYYYVYSIDGTLSLRLKKLSDARYVVSYYINGSTYDTKDTIPANAWSQITCSYKNAKMDVYTLQSDDYTKMKRHTIIKALSISSSAKCLAVGNYYTMNSSYRFAGNLDEFRVFNRALTLDEIKQNWNRTLAGSEEGLQMYWTFDEGLANQTIAYDFSKQNGVANGHHGFMPAKVSSSNDIPSEDQLSLMAYTDADGNYMIGGVPFSGDGTNYVLTPTKNSHQFSPSNQSRYFSTNSLIYTGVDFEDVSSFPVSGKVYYEGTTIPVKDVYVKVDGITASKNGEAVTTNSKGEFTVDVPIGEHFISLSLSGHTFVKGGYYPERTDSTINTTNFYSPVTGLQFYDNTLVTVAGRVAGGDIEYEKPLGLKQGKANIGKAVLTLEQENSTGYLNAKETTVGASVGYDLNDADRVFTTVSGTAKVAAKKNVITVETDPGTGEWVAKLPPLRYKVKSVVIPAQQNDITFNSLPVIDATNPNLTYTDSIKTKDEIQKFEYQASAKIEYKTTATFDVKENEDGSYGIKTYEVKDINGQSHTVDVYETKADGTIDYKFGYPIYEETASYTYSIHAREQYFNKDGAEVELDEVPLAGKKVTIKNQMASTSKVSATNGEAIETEDNSFELDSLGCATYEFIAGYPNIQEPYTRGLNITYENGGATVSWEKNDDFKAVVLGGLPTGNNFVTEGPDGVLMVLRDPPGTGSSATWSKGSSVSITKGRTVEPHGEVSGMATVYCGPKTTVGEGLGFLVMQDMDSKANLGVGFETSFSFSNMKNSTTTVTATRDISTSSAPDFVGPVGDLFIGYAKNVIFGAVHSLDIHWDNVNNMPQLKMEDAIATGEQFTTGFVYTQNYVENTLIPNFERLRDSLIVRVADINAVARPAAGKDPIYVTTLSKENSKFGSSNDDKTAWGNNAVDFEKMKDGKYVGPSYTMILPEDYETKNYQDMVKHYNEQIKKWENELRKNEEAKINAIENSKLFLLENHSFDAGGTITQSRTNETGSSRINTEVEEVNVVLNQETGVKINGVGVNFQFEEKVGITVTEEQQRDETETITTSYTLAEDGDDDYLSVDVFNAPDGFGPIFYTRAGATCCPYEDEVVTKYYRPGAIIMQKTVQIEKPEIEAVTQALTGIPAGGKGTFQVYIRNNSDTGEDGMYNINVVPSSNPDGLVVKMDGLNITTGRAIMVKAGDPMLKTFTVEQSNPDVLNYPDIKIRIASQCQPDNTGVFPEIADTTSISVYFQPTCSDVQLASSHSLVNTDTETAQTLSISGYNYSMASLEGIRLQYKGKNDADFTTLKEYVKDAKRVASDPNLELLPALEGTKKLNFVIDLREDDFTDQTYVFRAITVCNQGGVEVNNESDEIEVVRDMARPMLIATPTPASGILTSGADMTITFNEDIQASSLTEPNNFNVVGVLNETEVAHEVALSLTGENAAKTQSTVDLNNKSFATSMWVNYTTDGTLLQHGTSSNNFTVAIKDGKLAVSVNDSKAVSTSELPKNTWLYLNVSYNADNHSVSAGYTSDNDTKTLITEAVIDQYDGNGPVSLGGNNLTAKVQELSIWNDVRSMSQAQADMYTTKSQFTSGLLGYWQLNEGHGDVATDKARSRNLTLPSQNAWWIAGDNYALTLDGTKAAAVNIGALNTTSSEDYLVEAWFKADKEQNGVASVLSTEVMDLHLNAQGKMELVVNGTTAEVMNTDMRDGQWHHVAVNVLKGTNGSGIVYVDGVQRKQVSASAMPALYGAKLLLGGRYSYDAQAGYSYNQLLKGAVDEVRIWKGRRTADVIKNNMYARVDSTEAGLVAYYPMEVLGLDAYHQVVTTATLLDRTEKSNNEVSFYAPDFTSITARTSDLSAQNTAALKMAPSLTNVEFSFVASERQITVNLTEQPYKLEGCNIYITAKNVKDIHGNSANPITWGVYVQQNNLKWQENSMDVTKAGAEEKTFTATIENRGSENEGWSLSGMPEWLSANIDGGMLMPQASQNIVFTVAAGLPIGSYEAIVNLTGSQSINTPLYVTVSSEGDAPNWVATTGEHSMTVVGQLKIGNELSNDPKDMVAAFRGTECVGVAQPKYLSRYDSYMIMMSIYGDNEADLTYKAYDASTGTIYPSVSLSDNAANTFAADKAVGSFKNPVIFTPKNEIEQDLSMDKAGWKWFSLYAAPADATPSVIFKDAKDAISTLTNGQTTIINWMGNMVMNNYATMYKLNAVKAYEENFVGTPTDPAAIEISLKKNGWSWIGYPVQASNSVSAAFADAAPVDGDIVKSQSAFAIYTDGEWVGNLTAMVPGEGYLYKSEATADKTFHFPKPAVSGKRAASFTQTLPLNAKENMTMIAVVMNGDEVIENAEVSVFAGTELCGLSTATVNGKHFLTIGGEGAEQLTYVVKTAEGEYQLQQADIFQKDVMKGSMAQPYVLQLAETNAIDMALAGMNIKSIQLIDASGRTVGTSEKLYTKDDLKQLPAGVYFQQVTLKNGQTRVQKMTR